MVTCTLDARKLPRLYVGERCKRFQAKTWGRGGGGGTRNFRANDAKYFLCSQGVAVCRPMPHECAITRLLGASIFSFLGMEFIRSWAKKKKVRSRRGHRHMFYIQFPDNLLLI